ncbi:MAG: ZIP family metal transporter [Candidatus Magasanikbacteria bacterium]|nr:ZIP family metal transporter [Candidatus Magasanikbacteria bacterium]
MFITWLYAISSVIVVSLIAVLGILLFSIKTESLKKILLYLVSFSTGALFGGAFLHLLPEIVNEVGFTPTISFYILSGILFSFIIEKFIHWRHCHHPEHICDKKIHSFAYMNLFGDALHNFIDGLIIGASYLINIPLGLATTFAVILHEIPQEIGDFGVLLHGGFSKKKAIALNFATALTAVLGAMIALVVGSYTENLTQFLVPFAAGSFIYIAGSDLIPELQKEKDSGKSLLQLLAIILGILVLATMLLLPHSHENHENEDEGHETHAHEMHLE